MSESYREHCPLLSEDISDEEFKIQSSPQYHRRSRHSAYSGRAVAQAKGVATVVTRWPDHLTTLLVYWWAGLGMIALTIFIIYNSLSIIKTDSFASAASLQEPRYRENNFSNTSSINADFLKIFMHIFIKENEEISMEPYIRSIKTIVNKYSTFTYNFIVVIDDLTSNKDEETNDKKNNEIALNSLWINKNSNYKKQWIENISIQHVSLTNYLDESPLGVHWRRLPQQFIEFLVRCLSIWEKGGVAFNPRIITDKSSNSIYLEKMQNILKQFTKYAKRKYIHTKLKKHNLPLKNKPKKQVNNIRDIINNLSKEDLAQNSLQLNLTEAENREHKYLYNKNVKRDLQLMDSERPIDVEIIQDKYLNNNNQDDNTSKLYTFNSKYNKSLGSNLSENARINPKSSNENVTKSSLLPMFLKYIFHDETKKSSTFQDQVSTVNKFIMTSEIPDIENKKYEVTSKINSASLDVISKPGETIEFNNIIETRDQSTELTIDIKGNLIATKTPCHAFIGSIFSNIKHHKNEETLTDLIIAELSLFCKGLLSTCKGVDVILL